MNRKGLALSVVLLASVGAVSAFAAAGGQFGKGHGRHGHGGWHEAHYGMGEGGGMRERGRHGKRGGMGRMMHLKQLDTDKDGAVTLEEFVKPRQERFAALDTSKDGALDGGEVTARMQQMAGQRQRMMMATFDADGDGKVTREEFEKAAHHGRGGMRGHRGGGRHGWHRGRFGDEGPAASDKSGGADANVQQGMAGMPGMAGMEGGRGPGKRGAWRQQRFERMDANGDGVITAADLEARMAERLEYARKKKLHVLDKNGDGKVSADEFADRAKQRFADMDLDKDGKITAADLPPGMAERWEKKAGGGGDKAPAADEKK